MNKQPFEPTWKWHLKVWVVLLILCTAAFYAFKVAVTHLPPAYQHHTATPETTPWLHTEATP